MLQSISWQTYFTCCFCAVLFYYAAVGFIYYRFELAAIFRQPLSFKKLNPDSLPAAATAIADQPAMVSSLKDELIAFAETTGSSIEKQELIFGLKGIINKYSVDSVFQNEINATIMMACENNCSILLNEADTVFLWKG